MRLFCCILFCSSFLFISSLNASAQQESGGIIKTTSGEVFISNPETTIKAVANMRFIHGDSIQTGANSSAGLIFEDDTVVALGPYTGPFC